MDNVKRTLNLLDNLQKNYRSFILVLPWFAQRRALVALQMHTEEEVNVCVSDVDVSDVYEVSSWYIHERGISAVLKELVKLVLIQHFSLY